MKTNDRPSAVRPYAAGVGAHLVRNPRLNRQQALARNMRFNAQAAFTLLEIIIAVAIIGFFASVAVGKVVTYLNGGRYGAIKTAIGDLEAAAVGYVGKTGGLQTLPLSEGTIPSSQYSGTGTTPANVAAAATIDQMLLAEGFLKKPIQLSIPGVPNTPTGTTGVTWSTTLSQWTATAAPTKSYANVPRVETITSNPALTPDQAAGANFNTSGDGVTNLAANKTVMFFIIPNCPANTAWEISKDLDGQSLSQSDSTTADAKGIVSYPAPTGTPSTTTVTIFISDFN